MSPGRQLVGIIAIGIAVTVVGLALGQYVLIPLLIALAT